MASAIFLAMGICVALPSQTQAEDLSVSLSFLKKLAKLVSQPLRWCTGTSQDMCLHTNTYTHNIQQWFSGHLKTCWWSISVILQLVLERTSKPKHTSIQMCPADFTESYSLTDLQTIYCGHIALDLSYIIHCCQLPFYVFFP